MIDSKDKFIVKFRGVRGSHPKPERNFMEYGGNTACVEVHVNNHLIILDAGTGIINCGNELMQEHIAKAHKEPINATILLSHLHNDHIMGLPFFKPIHQKDSNINIVGFSAYEEGLDTVISQLVFEKSFPLGLNEINAKLSFYDINDNYALILDENDNTPDMIKTETKFTGKLQAAVNNGINMMKMETKFTGKLQTAMTVCKEHKPFNPRCPVHNGRIP